MMYTPRAAFGGVLCLILSLRKKCLRRLFLLRLHLKNL